MTSYAQSTFPTFRYGKFGKYGYNGGPLGQKVGSLYTKTPPKLGGMALSPTGQQDGVSLWRQNNPAPGLGALARAKYLGADFSSGGVPPNTPAAAGAAPGGGGGGGSYENDPIYLKIKAQADAQVDQAAASAYAQEIKALIQYGDPGLADQNIASRTRGPETAAKAEANPFSTVKELKRWNDRAQVNVDETRNSQGLFYSSTRARDKALQGEDYLRQSAKAANEVQDIITQIEQNLIAARQQAQMMILQAAESAYQRQLARGG